MDGTHVETVVPVHPGERKERIGFKGATGNTAFITSGSGRRQAAIMSSGTFGGRTHDIAASFHILDRLGRAARRAGAVVTVDADKGFVGIGGWISPEAQRHLVIREPHKDPPNGELSASQRAHNRRVSARRAAVEHYFHKIKQYKRADGPFIGTLEELGGVLQSVAGHQNARAMGLGRWEYLLEKYGLRVRRARARRGE